MSDLELRKSLLKLESATDPASIDPAFQQIIARDEKRTKWLTRAAIGLWVLVACGALFLMVVGGLAMPLVRSHMEQARELKAPTDGSFEILAKLTAGHMLLDVLLFGALAVSGLVTVILLLTLRRATLRQINANLLQISDQLTRLQRPG